jgi:hypothetical protein
MDIRGVHVDYEVEALIGHLIAMPTRSFSPSFPPPHSTHSLQPLDVVVFSPLSAANSQELVQHLHRTQGLIPVKKADLFPLFWPAYDVSFTSSNILKAFEVTGISPANAEVILKRFTSTPSGQDEDPEFAQHGDGSSWNELRKLFEVAVKDTAGDDAKRLGTAFVASTK